MQLSNLTAYQALVFVALTKRAISDADALELIEKYSKMITNREQRSFEPSATARTIQDAERVDSPQSVTPAEIINAFRFVPSVLNDEKFLAFAHTGKVRINYQREDDGSSASIRAYSATGFAEWNGRAWSCRVTNIINLDAQPLDPDVRFKLAARLDDATKEGARNRAIRFLVDGGSRKPGRSALTETQPFTAADKAGQPTDLTVDEQYTRRAILDVIDERGYYLWASGEAKETNPEKAEADENAWRLRFADAVIVRLREMYDKLRERVGMQQVQPAKPERDHWISDKDYPVEDWRLEAANDDTRLGYNDWIEARRDEEQPTLTSPTKMDAALASLKDKLAGAGSNVEIEEVELGVRL